MRRMSLPVVLAAMAIALAWSPLNAQRADSAPDVRTLKALFDAQFARLYNAADAAGLAALWVETGSYSSTVPGKPILSGRSAIEKMWAVGFTPNQPWPNLTVVLRNTRVIGGRRAEVDGVMTYRNAAAAASPTSDFTAALVIEGSAWKIVSLRTSLLRGLRID